MNLFFKMTLRIEEFSVFWTLENPVEKFCLRSLCKILWELSSVLHCFYFLWNLSKPFYLLGTAHQSGLQLETGQKLGGAGWGGAEALGTHVALPTDQSPTLLDLPRSKPETVPLWCRLLLLTCTYTISHILVITFLNGIIPLGKI